MKDAIEEGENDTVESLAEENLRLAQRCLELEDTARKRIAKLESLAALLKSNDSDLRRVVEDAAFGFLLLNRDQTVINANRAACAALGRRLTEISGLDFRQFVYVEKLAAFAGMVEAATQSSRPSILDIDLVDGKGELVHCRLAVSPWFDSANAIQGVLVLLVDNTREAQADEVMRRLRLSAHEHRKSRDVILGIVERELTPPANSIIGMTRMLMETKLSDRQRELAAVILSSADSLVRLVDSIGEISGPGLDDRTVNLHPVNVLALCRSVAGFFAARAEEKGLDVEVVQGSGVPEAIVADAICLRRVLTHLVDNAVKFTERGRITLSVDVVADRVRFMVSDTGPGLYSGAGDEIFEDYPGGRTASGRRSGGLGVGLSICRRLVAAMGGKIGFESIAGKGSEFHFAIPLVAASAEEIAAADLRLAPERPVQLRLPPLRILATGANPMLARWLSAVLGIDGHETTVVENGFDAAEVCRANQFDALILDLQTAKLDGVQTLRMIRDRENRNKPVPAVLLAPAAAGERFDAFLADGFAAVVKKPVDPVELMAAIRDATGVEPLVERRATSGVTGVSVRSVNIRQLANVREMMSRPEFVGILRVFMEDSVPDVIRIVAMAESAEPDWERILFIAVKARGMAAYLGLADLADVLARVGEEGRGGRSAGELLELAGELRTVMDDTLEDLKCVAPEAFSTLSAVAVDEPADAGGF